MTEIQLLTGKKQQLLNGEIKATLEKLNALILTPDNRFYGKMEIDPDKIVYNVQRF